MKNFLGGLVAFVVALVAVSAAFFAVELGHSAVICTQGAVGWAIVEFFGAFLVLPPLFGFYLTLVVLAATLYRPALARFGAGGMMGWGLVAVMVLLAAGAVGTAILGLAGRCSLGF